MQKVHKTVLVPYPAEHMFALVDRVEDYALFLPWCKRSEVRARNGHTTLGSLTLDYHHVRQTFTTRNTATPPLRIDVDLVEGPFKQLTGYWHFIPLGDQGCKIEFELRYAFANHLLERLIGPVFQKISATLVDAFIGRAKELARHGNPPAL